MKEHYFMREKRSIKIITYLFVIIMFMLAAPSMIT